MTTLTKALAVVSLLLAAGAAYQGHRLSRQRAQSHALMQETGSSDTAISLLREQRNQILEDLVATTKLLEATQPSANHSTQESELGAWLSRVSYLEKWLRQSPGKGIPEMKFLNSNDWLSVTMNNPLDTDAKIRNALSKLRRLAKMKPQVADNLSKALQAYRTANNGLLPSDPTQLRPYLNPWLSDDLLNRYEPAPEVPGSNDANGVIRDGLHLTGNGRVVLQEKSPVDADYDTWFGFTEKGGWAINGTSELGKTVDTAMEAYSKTNSGHKATNPEQLLPYLPTPVEPTRLKEYWDVSRH